MISLRARLAVFYAAVVTLTVALVAGLGFWLVKRQLLADVDYLLDAEGREILAQFSGVQPPLTRERAATAVAARVRAGSAVYYFQIHAPNAVVLYRSPNLGNNLLPDLTGGQMKRTADLSFGRLRVAEYPSPLLHLQLAMSLAQFSPLNFRFATALAIGLPLVAVLSAGVGLALSRFTLWPLRMIQEAAGRISASNLSERIPIPRGTDEVAALARLLNDTFSRLEKSFGEIKRFTADTSHELMTPLSILRLHAEKLLGDPTLSPAARHSVEEQLEEIQHLTATLDRLLVLTKADLNVLPLNLAASSTRDFITQFAEDAELLAESRSQRFSIGVNDDLKASFDHGWIRQVLFNLLANALRFNPRAGTITLHSRRTAAGWTIEAWDEGPGVPTDRLEEIFGRFVQLTPRSPGGATTGSGLGLAICKSLVEIHKGTISARNRTDRSGLIVSFTLPVVVKPDAEPPQWSI